MGRWFQHLTVLCFCLINCHFIGFEDWSRGCVGYRTFTDMLRNEVCLDVCVCVWREHSAQHLFSFYYTFCGIFTKLYGFFQDIIYIYLFIFKHIEVMAPHRRHLWSRCAVRSQPGGVKAMQTHSATCWSSQDISEALDTRHNQTTMQEMCHMPGERNICRRRADRPGPSRNPEAPEPLWTPSWAKPVKQHRSQIAASRP